METEAVFSKKANKRRILLKNNSMDFVFIIKSVNLSFYN